jgi:hypothetical protein
LSEISSDLSSYNSPSFSFDSNQQHYFSNGYLSQQDPLQDFIDDVLQNQQQQQQLSPNYDTGKIVLANFIG